MRKKSKEAVIRLFYVWVLFIVLGIGNVAKADTVIHAKPITTEAAEDEDDDEDEDDESMIQGWNDNKTSYYVKGKAVVGVKKINGSLYYFNKKGKLFTKKGLYTIEGNTYFFKGNHTMKTGVVKVDGKYYYFRKKTGARYENAGIHKLGTEYYNFSDDYELQSGWARNSKNKRYYFNKKKFAATKGWKYIGKYKYYFNKNGQLCQDLRKKMEKQIKNQASKKTAYEIRVNRAASCVTVYAKDGIRGYTIPVVAFVCSAGNATPIGTVSIKDKLRWHELMGPCWGQWCAHLTSDILFHSVYYNRYHDNRSLSVSAYNKLGTVASHGCVRLTAGDSKWIYDYCAVGTKVIIYDDKNYPGPFDKPKAQKLSPSHTWDPTDPNIK
ncbi:MAG: L,D-transpeptidase family protein [Eubacteriales bacterium]|nr:L,D-transpeptidase family protein [Eubacteriales bacterium]